MEFRYKVNWRAIVVDTDVEPKITDGRKRKLCVFYKRGAKRVQRFKKNNSVDINDNF